MRMFHKLTDIWKKKKNVVQCFYVDLINLWGQRSVDELLVCRCGLDGEAY